MRSQEAPRDLSGADGRPDAWEHLEARIAPACPKGGGKGRQPHPPLVMLRVHCVQPFCNLSDPAMEDRLARRRASGALPGRCLRRYRTRKGNRWHFGMKLHIGTDPRRLVHHLEGTAANAHHLTPSDRLLHGEEKQVRADAGNRGIGKRAKHAHREVSWRIALPPGQRRTLAPVSAAAKAETAKARVRVEHPFRIASGCSAATWFAIGVWRGTCSGLRRFWASRT